jgi:hypothetical protein
MSDALQDLMSTGVPSASFLEIGTVVEGTILKMEKLQQRDMESGALKTWDDGNPMWQFVFTLQTELRDPELEFDDGIRKVYAKAQMEKAIRDAIRKSGHKGDIEGGTLAVKYIRQDPPKTRGFSGPKVYAAKFTAPTQTAQFEETAGPDQGGEEPPFDDESVF